MNAFTAKFDATVKDKTSAGFDGFKTIVEKEMEGENLMKTVTVSEKLGNLRKVEDYFTPENAVDLLEDFYWSRDEFLRSQQTKLYLSSVAYYYYMKDYRGTFGALPYNDKFVKRSIDGAEGKVELVPLDNVPTDFMMLTPKSNVFCLFNQKTKDERYLLTESKSNHYDVDFIADAFYGEQFQQVEKEVFSAWMGKPIPTPTVSES